MMLFANRKEAGHLLARKLSEYSMTESPNLCVIAIPRGGVPVAAEIAKAFHAPLDVFVVRKLGVPSQPELAFGAVAEGNVQVINQAMVKAWSLSTEFVDSIVAHERKEVRRWKRLYRDDRSAIDVQGKTVILVDDGIATSTTVRAAIEALMRKQPAYLIVATPVAPPQICTMLRTVVDDVICLIEPQWFDAIGSWYADFSQVSHSEVRKLLDEAQIAANVPV